MTTAQPVVQTDWEALRSGDGSPIVVQFDWYDDHSSWRLEELSSQIDEANTILTEHGHDAVVPSHLGDLTGIVDVLRFLYRDDAAKDATVRKALTLADELDFRDVESSDASFEYECIIDRVNELLEAWETHHRWIYSDDEWDLAPTRWHERLVNSRNGLGERWSLTFEDGVITFTDGSTLTGLNPDERLKAMFNLVYEQNDDESTYPSIVEILRTLPEQAAAQVETLLTALVDADVTIDRITVQAVKDIVSKEIDAKALEEIGQFVTALAEEWHGNTDELLNAASALVA